MKEESSGAGTVWFLRRLHSPGFPAFDGPKRSLEIFQRFHLRFDLKILKNLALLHTYMAHAVAFAAIRTTKTREHFAESSYTTQLRVQTMHNTRIVLPVASTIARAEICFGCWRDRPFLNRTHLVLIAHFSTARTWKAVGNTTGLRRSLHPRWRISLLQSLCRALGQTEASFTNSLY